MKLTSISDHSNFLQNLVITMSERWYYHRKRVEFGRQTLNISMFIPAKFIYGKWVVFKRPKDYEDVILQGSRVYHYDDILACREYKTAKSNVLFEGFEIITDEKNRQYFTYEGQSVFIDKCWALRHETVEDIVELQPTLTTTAEKQIGL